MLNKFIENYDAIVLVNNKNGEILFQNNSFKNLTNNNITSYDDLEQFFIYHSKDKTQSPIFDLFELNNDKYLIKRKLIGNDIILSSIVNCS